MSSIADRIKIAQDKDGMLRRALERIIQLYTDRSHFVYELLQNAEDADATSVKFVQYPDRLEVMHDGRPFTAQNLQGLCDIGKSDKVDNLNQIGEFGVGFKSVFGICDTVRLYSVPAHFRGKDVGDAIPFAVEIIDFTSPQDIPQEEIEHSCKYLKYDEYKDEILRIIKELFVIRCKDGTMRNAFMTRIFLPVSQNGIRVFVMLPN